MKMRIALVLSAGILGLGAPVFAASLEEELAGLLLDHPNIRAAYKTVESSRQGISQAKSAYYPQISVSADVGQEVIDSPSERNQGDGQQGKPSSRTSQHASLSVAQNLFNGFATASAVLPRG
jgi:outer membrane protein TolC